MYVLYIYIAIYKCIFLSVAAVDPRPPALKSSRSSVRPVGQSLALWQAIQDGHPPPGGFANSEERAAWTAATFAVTKFV